MSFSESETSKALTYNYLLGKDQGKKKCFHRRTISRASDDLGVVLNFALSQPSQILSDKNPTQNSIKINSKTQKHLKTISEEEYHIRKIINQRKISSLSSSSDSEQKMIKKNSKETVKVSFNSSTTANTVIEENSASRVSAIIGTTVLRGNQDALRTLANLLEMNTEAQYVIVIDLHYSIIGVSHLDSSTGYLHRVIGTDELNLIVPPRKIRNFFLYDNQNEKFKLSSSGKFDAVMI